MNETKLALAQKVKDALDKHDPVAFEVAAMSYMNELSENIAVAISPTRLSVVPCVVAVLEIYAEHFRKKLGNSGNGLADELKGGINNFISIVLPNDRRSE